MAKTQSNSIHLWYNVCQEIEAAANSRLPKGQANSPCHAINVPVSIPCPSLSFALPHVHIDSSCPRSAREHRAHGRHQIFGETRYVKAHFHELRFYLPLLKNQLVRFALFPSSPSCFRHVEAGRFVTLRRRRKRKKRRDRMVSRGRVLSRLWQLRGVL
jgi:hypothetical protein